VAFPLVVGRDRAGTVAAVGAGVSDVRPGDRVWANSAGYGGRPGATAGLVRVAPERLYRLPDGAGPLAFVTAVHPGATAYGVLTGRARVQPGETVAVIGGNGAVGMCLIQVAAADGAHPIAVVRDGRTESALRELGAQQVAAAAAAGGLLGFIMSAMTVSELAAAAAWINAQPARRPLAVSLAPGMRFGDTARAHQIIEQGRLPHLPDHTIGRITLQP
jgi:NADPH:quinone reductase-like Zn-dependent oxidoreductase